MSKSNSKKNKISKVRDSNRERAKAKARAGDRDRQKSQKRLVQIQEALKTKPSKSRDLQGLSLNTNRERYIKKAIELSFRNVKKNLGGPFGAVIVLNNKMISEGWNEVTSNNDPTAHAEVMAIRKACKKLNTFNLENCEIYTSCEPCPMCLAAIYWARINKIYYANTKEDASSIGFDDSLFYLELKKKAKDRKIKMIQLKDKDRLTAFIEWSKLENKIKY